MQTHVYVRQDTLAAAAAAIGVSQNTLARYLKAGAPCDKLGRNRVRGSTEEIRAWLIEREAARAAGGAR
jgi:hypothetical protein